MKSREKYLAIGLLVVIIGYFGSAGLSDWLFKPFKDKEQQIANLRSDLEAVDARQGALLKAASQMAVWKKEGLVFDPLVAQRMYQSWLTDLSDDCGWKNVTVTPGNTKLVADKTAIAVSIVVEGEATLGSLARFVSMFEGAELFHRIERLDIKPSSKEPNAPMKVMLTAEAMAINGAKRRPLPYTQWQLVDRLEANQLYSRVEPPTVRLEDLPFEFQIGQDRFKLINVEDDGSGWIFQPVGERKQSRTLPRGTRLNYINESRPADQLGETWASVVKASPFSLPLPVVRTNPQIEVAGSLRLTRGTPFEATLRTSGFSPEAGTLTWEFDGATPDGMTLNPTSGTIRWNPAADIAIGDIPVRLKVATANGKETATRNLTVLIRDPNTPPTIEELGSKIAYSGEAWSLPLLAKDLETPVEQLKYSVSGTVPEGLRVDPATRSLVWSPKPDQENKTYTVAVTVTDNGEPAMTDRESVTIKVTHNKETTLMLFGSTSINGEQKVWFKDQRTQQGFLLGVGEKLDASGFQGTIQSIEGDRVLMQSDEKTYALPLGKTVAERTAL